MVIPANIGRRFDTVQIETPKRVGHRVPVVGLFLVSFIK